MNKYYFFGVISVLGILAMSFGVWAKITHQANADMVIATGLTCLAIGLSALVWFLFIWLNKKN